MPKGIKNDGTPLGGAGRGAGRKSPYSEKTKTVNFKCPVSKEEEFRNYCEQKLLTYQGV